MGALGAAKMGWNLYKHFSLVETSATAEERFGWMKAFKKYAPVATNLAKHAYNAYNSLAQTNATAVQKKKWLGMALKAAHMGYNLWKATRLAETSSASKLKFGWFKAIKKYGPTAIKLAGQAYHAYNNAARPVPLPRKEAGGAMPSRQPPTLSRPTDPLLLRWLKQATMLTTRPRPVPMPES